MNQLPPNKRTIMKLLNQALCALALLVALEPVAHAGVVADHPGYWMGDLTLPDGRVLKSGMELFKRADGSAWASFASPDQSVYDIPVIHVEERGDTAQITLPFGDMTITWAGTSFKAEWHQGGASFPLELKRVSAFPHRTRPQDPVGPFPYTEKTIAIPGADGVMLGATLSIPKGVIKPDVVVLVHGSGPETRDEEVAGHRVFAVLADHLLRQGIAVLRYDKRGVSRSTGDYEHHTQSQLVDDLAAVVDALKARHEFGRLGLIGHSEGAQIAAAVTASKGRSIDFLVSLGGVGLPGTDLILLQDEQAAKDRNASTEDITRLMRYVRGFYQIVIAEPDNAARVAALKAYQDALPDTDKDLIAKYEMNRGTLSLDLAAQPFLRVLLMADPRPDWRRVRCPVLALNGSLDHQVPVQSLSGIAAALSEGGNKRVESVVVPSANHLFQTAQTGSEAEYGEIEETIAQAVLNKISAFFRKP